MKTVQRKPIVRPPGKIGRADPSRTITLRRQFQADVNRRFARLRQEIIHLVREEDVFGLNRQSIFNVFCPTGKGGGIDPTCSPRKGGESKNAPKVRQLKIDNPWGEWLEHERARAAKSRLKTAGAVTAYWRGEIAISDVIDIPGYSGEEKRIDWIKVGRLADSIRKHGYREDAPVTFHVVYDGRAYVYDGNHRLRAAKEAGIESVPAEISYFAGGEEVEGKLFPSKFTVNKQFTLNAPGRWIFHTSLQKVQAFAQWLQQQILQYVFEGMAEEGVSWLDRYILDGYRRGTGRAFDDTRPQVREWRTSPEAQRRLSWYEGTRDEFLRSAFAHPASKEKTQLLVSRTFTDLKNVTNTMANSIRRVLVDGFVTGSNPREIAVSLAKEVDVSRKRALTIARTEVIRAHAEGQLDAFERLGVTHVGAMVEWLTAGDERVCQKCAALNGIVLKIPEARGLLPRHPNCRCCWSPANLGESTVGQKRTKPAIEDAIEESYGDENRSKSRWAGADKTISKSRPKGVFNIRYPMSECKPVSSNRRG